MSQQTLHHSLVSQSMAAPPSGRAFLDLPYAVRYRIYALAGLVRFCPIDLNLEGANKMRPIGPTTCRCHYYKIRFDCHQDDAFGYLRDEDVILNYVYPRLPYELLYVSRAVHDEVQSIFYSENKFRISRSNQWRLKPLGNLSPEALASLTSLTVRLNNYECLFAHDCRSPPVDCMCHPLCNSHNLHDQPLGHLAQEDISLISDWNDIVIRIAAHIRPSRLSLSVICDTQGQEAAQLIVQPLLQLPLLKHSALRLGGKPNWELQGIATRMANRLIGRLHNPAKDHAAPRFTSLPEEI
ncbi:MAG: hypothetical protein M1816_003716 [Peltula sp. TS41687]|nr:MAG: hypothetical protein M1816_003716 [Peltula sp. TS41687]